MAAGRTRSTLHLQLGQETIYLIMAIAVFAAVFLALLLTRKEQVQKDPPIILMREADGYSFATGSAAISSAFATRLTAQVLPKVRDAARKNDAQVIEVIGHTDEVPLRRSSRLDTNLDSTLAPLLGGKGGDTPIAADNVGLGMARAVAVAALLRREPGMRRFQVMPLSAGPFERVDDTVSQGDAASDGGRRRIEIRVRRREVR